METKELKIQIPEGYEIDREGSTFEKIMFKKKGTNPRSWEEYCNLQIINNKKGYDINGLTSEIDEVEWDICTDSDLWRNVLPSIELAKASRTMMQLMSLRQAWIRDWQPCWNGRTIHYCIVCFNNGYTINGCAQCCHALSFPTEEMALDFMNCFKDLLEIVKPLI